MHEGFRGVDRGPVHHFHAAGDDAGADNARHAFAGVFHPRKTDHQRPRRFRFLQDPHRDLGDDAEQAFGPGNDPHQVIARVLGGLAADLDDLARHQHDLAAQHVVGGHAVFQAMHAAGILGDVAADRAGDLRGRIGRIIKSGMRHRLAEGEVGHPGLGHHGAVIEVDLADALELAEAEQHRVGQRQRAARQRGAGAARNDLDALLETVFQHLRHLRGRVRQHHDHRRLAIGGQTVGLVGDHFIGAVDDALARHDGAQRADDGGAAAKDRLIRCRHHDGHTYVSRRRMRVKAPAPARVHWFSTANLARLDRFLQHRPAGMSRACGRRGRHATSGRKSIPSRSEP